MLENPVFFYIASVIIVASAIMSLCLKKVVYSLLSAIIVFFCGSVLFFILGSEYNAIIQAAVYGLAVPVIIGLSIMFTIGNQDNKKDFTLSYVTILCGGIFVLAFVYLIMISLVMLPDTFNLKEIPQINSYDVISSFAKGIFIDYVWAFELLSLLLTIVITGITLFVKRERL